MREELESFVASLAIPDDRKHVVLAELVDHVASAREAAVREGMDPEAAARAALGDLEVLRRSLEAVEPAFRVTRTHATVRGLAAGIGIAVLIDRLGATLWGIPGALGALAIVVVLAPPRVLELLRAELRARQVRGALLTGVPIGPALVYGFTVMYAPLAIWIGLIVERAYGGQLDVDVPWSAFAVMMAVWSVLLVEGVRARQRRRAA